VLFDKIASEILFEKCVYSLALEMASSENQHCANRIGTLLFPITGAPHCSGTCTGMTDLTVCVVVLCRG